MGVHKYEPGLVSISFREQEPKEILQAAKAAGISFIEWGSDVHAPCHDSERLCAIARMQEEYGVLCSSYGTYFRLGQTPLSALESYVAAAKILGTDVLRLWCGSKCGADMTEEEKEFLFAQCRKAAAIAARHSVTLCMECHKNTFTQRLDDALALMREIASPNFQMYWQPFQWQDVAENLAYAEAIAPFTRHIHVFHWKGEERFSLGEGIDEWRLYLRKFSTPRTLLLEFMPDDRLSSLAAEANALRMITGEER